VRRVSTSGTGFVTDISMLDRKVSFDHGWHVPVVFRIQCIYLFQIKKDKTPKGPLSTVAWEA
jgi:hypothetical protein